MSKKIRSNKMEENRKDEAKELVEKFEKNKDLAKIESLIKDNIIEFDYKDKLYRVRLLTLREKEELNQLISKKVNSMLQEKDEQGNYVYLTEKALIKLLKERDDIDVNTINDDIKKVEAEENNLMLKLGEAISKNEMEIVLKTYKEQIEDLRVKRMTLDTQKTLILEFSLENQILGYQSKFITYLTLEIKDNNTWERLFNTLEEFDDCLDDSLKEEAARYSVLLQYI
jgi:hypothetical protein